MKVENKYLDPSFSKYIISGIKNEIFFVLSILKYLSVLIADSFASSWEIVLTHNK